MSPCFAQGTRQMVLERVLHQSFFFFKSGTIIVAEPGICFSPALTEGQIFVPSIGNIQKMM